MIGSVERYRKLTGGSCCDHPAPADHGDHDCIANI